MRTFLVQIAIAFDENLLSLNIKMSREERYEGKIHTWVTNLSTSRHQIPVNASTLISFTKNGKFSVYLMLVRNRQKVSSDSNQRLFEPIHNDTRYIVGTELLKVLLHQ